MKIPAHLVPGIAGLLSYPDGHSRPLAVTLAEAAMATGHPCQEHLEAFALAATTLSLGELQEQYTRTFDLSPETTLEVGWHLFGESYPRGQFLAMMRHHLRQHGIDEAGNLPDFLPSLLDLGARLDTADALDLVDDCILPALEKLLPALGPRPRREPEGAPDSGAASPAGSPYFHLLQALFLIFTVDRKPAEAAHAE